MLEQSEEGQWQQMSLKFSETLFDHLTAAVLLEGQGRLQEALTEINIAVNLVEAELQEIADQETRMLSFSHSDSAGVFNCAVRLSLKLHTVQTNGEQASDDGESRPSATTWSTQALTYAEGGKARSMLEGIDPSTACVRTRKRQF